MTPSKSELESLRQRLAEVNHLAGRTTPAIAAADIPRAVVILGSSRSGSSLLFHRLAQTGAFWSPQGEETPFYRLAGLGWVNFAEQSDAIRVPVSESVRKQAFDLLMNDVGRTNPKTENGTETETETETESTTFLSQIVRRLLLQWPTLQLEPARVFEAAKSSLRSPDATTLWHNLLERLQLEPGLYDLPGPKSRNLQFEAPDYVLEEPPFILQHRREAPTAETLRQAPLLLKTSTNAYRIAWLKTLFPRTEFRWIVLGRNPAASINGMMDGWLSNAFHSHNLQFVRPLKIRGYSDKIAYGGRWWKFDLPPGWTDYDDAPLEDVCAFQWRSAYSAILKSVDTHVLHVKHEELIAPATASSAIQRIFEFAGVPLSTPPELDQPPVMASAPPVAARWRQRESQIWPLVQTPAIREIAERLGYDLSSPDGLL